MESPILLITPWAAAPTWTPCFAAQSAPSISWHRFELRPITVSWKPWREHRQCLIQLPEPRINISNGQWAKISPVFSFFSDQMGCDSWMTSQWPADHFEDTKAPTWLHSHTRPRSCRALSEQQKWVAWCEDAAPSPTRSNPQPSCEPSHWSMPFETDSRMLRFAFQRFFSGHVGMAQIPWNWENSRSWPLHLSHGWWSRSFSSWTARMKKSVSPQIVVLKVCWPSKVL